MSGGERAIEKVLANRIGLEPDAIGTRLIKSAVARRMLALRIEGSGDYERLLDESEAEFQALVDEVVVPESWFFRDERPFEWLRELIRARWMNDPRLRSLRILSLGCAGGEEPYSIAILALDLGLSPRRIEIDAVDISERRLSIAREAIYGPHAFRGDNSVGPPGYRDRFFQPHPLGHELNDVAKSVVRFVHGSVIDPRLLEASAPYDIVLCRNVFIYLNRDARARLIATIDRLLAPEGALVVGHADRLDSAALRSRYRPAGQPGCCVHQKLAPSVKANDADATPKRSAPRARAASAPPPSAAIQPKMPAPRVDSVDASVEHAAELANQGKIHDAIAVCERIIRRKGPTAGAFFLMGMIRQAAGERAPAEDCFKKAVYLDPTHTDALLALALLAERRGDFGQAAGYRRRLERITSSTPTRTA
jgi:chemotaxis protein methyltransferase WspC